MSDTIAATDENVELLRLMCDVAGHAELSARRTALIEGMLRLIGADAGWWAWGHGHPMRSAVAPVALIPIGFAPEQLGKMIEAGLDPDCGTFLFSRVAARLDGRPQFTYIRRDLIDDADWYPSRVCELWRRAGFDDFVHCVRDDAQKAWSTFFALKRHGNPGFGSQHRALVDRAMAGVKWLHVNVEEVIPGEQLQQLTSRQRTVLLMTLDGLPRREIAYRLHISEHTVHEHLKRLYRHFEVSSAIELSARFLRAHS